MVCAEELISIVIPTFNRCDVLFLTLPHYLNQKCVKEVIVVDDGSIDGTKESVGEFSMRSNKIKYVPVNSHRGASFARNAGISIACGKYILLGEDDVMLSENYTTQLLECLAIDNATLISGRIIYLQKGETSEDALKRSDNYTGPLINKKLLFLHAWKKLPSDQQIPFTHGCFMFKREITRYCKFDEKYGGNGWRDETDFQLQAARLGYKTYICPHTTCYHLPRDLKDKGGQWSMNCVSFNLWSLKNNHYFLTKHYDFLKTTLGSSYKKNQLIIFAFLDRVRFLLSQIMNKFKDGV